MGRFTNRVLSGILAVIALAILLVALYVIFQPMPCAPGTSRALDCAAAPPF